MRPKWLGNVNNIEPMRHEKMDFKDLKRQSPDWLSPIWETIERYYSQNTYKRVVSGSFAVCPRQPLQIGEAYWMHAIGRPAPKEALKNIEIDLGFRYFNEEALTHPLIEVTEGYDFDHFVPEKFIQLLRCFNGLRLFGGHFSIPGVLSVSREKKNSIHGDLPITEGELTRLNIYDRPRNIPPKILVIAGYGSNGSLVYLKEGTDTVYCCNLSGDTLKTWPSIETWLKDEISRLSCYFDNNGTYIASMGSTHP